MEDHKRKLASKEKIKNRCLYIKYLKDSENKDVWHILFQTKFGETTCLYTPHNEKWRLVVGNAKGVGVKKMLSYLQPLKPKRISFKLKT